jgi:hypothetical protein
MEADQPNWNEYVFSCLLLKQLSHMCFDLYDPVLRTPLRL